MKAIAVWQSCVCILRKLHCPCFLFPVHALGNSYPTFRFLHAILNSFLKKLMEEKAHISYLLKYFLLLTLFSKYIHISTRYSLSSWQCGYSEFFPLPFFWKCQLLLNSPLFFPLKMNIVYAYWRRRKKRKVKKTHRRQITWVFYIVCGCLSVLVPVWYHVRALCPVYCYWKHWFSSWLTLLSSWTSCFCRMSNVLLSLFNTSMLLLSDVMLVCARVSP